MGKFPIDARDPNEFAHAVFLEAIGEAPPSEPERQKNPVTVALGRLEGVKGGKARTAKMTPEERAESAQKAAKARWGDGKR